MKSQDWKTRPVSLSQLNDEAEAMGEVWKWGAFAFLKNTGVVPWDIESMPRDRVRFNFDPEKVPAGYLASAAYEWDSWGFSYPTEFIAAIEAELRPEKRDFIASLLTALGRTVTECK